ncbi:Dipeptidyl aminopeptidases/acylaminoacyl-peptidases [hydrothermal vent metagenome]|uniref:Dipeptidyl aminopeptidases/acylaminoacyl-peptidases n=1 Tax=hydrothermal vent metagenome TaxID=652676 RepID=A0A170QDC3_9ZZZZ|tara:strand:+ start:55 stop:2466 length:2412 start_codon:yes stop_codon:yes gene_type:complete
MKKTVKIFIIFFLTITTGAVGDDGYKMPPKAIRDLVDAPLTPVVSISSDKKHILILERASLPSIEELSQTELRLAGLRINPKTNGRSRSSYYTGIVVQEIKSGRQKIIKGLPKDGRISNVGWSPNGKHIAMTVIRGSQINLYTVDIKSSKAKLLFKSPLNTIYGTPFYWLSNSKGLVTKTIISGRGDPPKLSSMPKGPVVQENLGKKAAVRTYQDLLTNSYDEALFKYYMNAQVVYVNLKGKTKKIGQPGIIRRNEPSPDGNYILLETIHQPFSYLVPLYRFPILVEVLDIEGNPVHTLRDIPLAESIPIGRDAVISGPRSFGWRADLGATIYYVEALDGGDPNVIIEHRDQVYTIDPPFNVNPEPFVKLNLRYSGIQWGNREIALVSARKWSIRRTTTWLVNPSNKSAEKIIDRSYEDRYADPGRPMTDQNQYGRSVLLLVGNGHTIYMSGNGASPEGDLPFVDEFSLKTKKTVRLWRAEAPYYETPISIFDPIKKVVLTRRESKDEIPNYYLRSLIDGSVSSVTDFKHPYPQMMGIYKEMLTYKRADGIDLSATLYLPPGRKPGDGPLPLLVWAYPREFKTSKAASQVVGSPHRFSRISPTSSLIMLAYGYAVLSGATMPIIGEGDSQPNDAYVKQLVGSAQAAVDIMIERGITTKDQIAIGGHSYGAFMTANLLAHSDIFQAGIARSGAYNRSLTPFGFQSEERTFWEAPEIYFAMSPFMHAQKVNEPILLIHGEADNNSGTFPVQSKRFYHALKGHGATAKLVMLPHESHGYRARESVMHMLWETANWLDTYVKKDVKE